MVAPKPTGPTKGRYTRRSTQTGPSDDSDLVCGSEGGAEGVHVGRRQLSHGSLSAGPDQRVERVERWVGLGDGGESAHRKKKMGRVADDMVETPTRTMASVTSCGPFSLGLDAKGEGRIRII